MKDLSSLSSKIRENKVKSMRMTLHPQLPPQVIAEWISALEVNESLTSVQVVCCGSFSSSSQRELLCKSLLRALLGLPHLQRLQLKGNTGGSENTARCVIPVSLFSDLQLVSKQLFSFSLVKLSLSVQDPRDFQGFAHWIREMQPSLQDFQLISIALQHGAATTQDEGLTTSVLEPLLTTLATFPRLSNLEISGTVTPLGVLDAAPTALFQSKSLKRLSISDFIFSPSALSSLFATLKTDNHCLQELALSGDLTREVTPQLARLLEDNRSLEALALRLDSLKDEQCNQEMFRAMVGTRSNLKVLSLCSFDGASLSASTRSSLVKMLCQNSRLEYLYVPRPYTDTVFWDQVRFYLGMNVAGRKHNPQDGHEKKENVMVGPSSSEVDIRSEIQDVFQWLKTSSGPGPVPGSAPSSSPCKVSKGSTSCSSASSPDRMTLKSTLTPSAFLSSTSSLPASLSPFSWATVKRPEQRAHKARRRISLTNSKFKHQPYHSSSRRPSLPTDALSTLCITRS